MIFKFEICYEFERILGLEIKNSLRLALVTHGYNIIKLTQSSKANAYELHFDDEQAEGMMTKNTNM